MLIELARAAEWRPGEFKAQEIANTAWAFATLGQTHLEQFSAVSAEGALCPGRCTAQNIAHSTWAFATFTQQGEELFAVLAAESAQRLNEFSPQNNHGLSIRGI